MTLQVKWMSLSVGLALCFVVEGGGARAFAEDARVTKQLQDQLEKTKGTLGKLQPWQEEIFSNEVLTSTGRFIKDYATKNGKVTSVEVDQEGLKRYLSFHATGAGIQGETKRILLSVSLEGECESCAKSIPLIRKEWKEKLERRGLDPIVLTPNESKKTPSDFLAAKNAGSWAQLKVIADSDPDHIGESLVRTKLEIKFPGTDLSSVAREVEVPARDSIEVTVARLFIEGMTQLGSESLKISTHDTSDAAFKVAVKHLKSFNQLQEAKTILQAIDPTAKVVEFELARADAVFAVSPPTLRPSFLQKYKASKGKIIGDENAVIVELALNLTPPPAEEATSNSAKDSESE